MTVRIKHNYSSTRSDGTDSTQVQPSHWNADHAVQMTGPAILGREAATQGDASEIALGTGLTLSGGVLSASGGGGSAIEVMDEGTSLTTALTRLNFVGASVTASAAAGAVTVDVTGGGGGATNLTQSTTATSVTVLSDTGTDATIGGATDSVAGVMIAADKAKLDGIAAAATANATDAALRDRTTHTGSQAIATVTGLQTALDGKQTAGTYATGTGSASGVNTGDQTEITGNAGTATALSAGADRTKLDGIAAGATANAADATLLNRASHTGTQPAATIGDSTTVGRSLLTATDVYAQQALLGVTSQNLDRDTGSNILKNAAALATDSANWTRVGTLAGWAFGAGGMQVTAGTQVGQSFSENIYLTSHKTLSHAFKVSAKWTMQSATGVANVMGPRIGVYCAANPSRSMQVMLNCSNDSGSGRVRLYNNGNPYVDEGRGMLPCTAGDLMETDLTVDGTLLTAVVRNITQSLEVWISYRFVNNTNASSFQLNAVASLTVGQHGIGSFTVSEIAFTSLEQNRPDVLVVGDSISTGSFAGLAGNSWPEIVARRWPDRTFTRFSGPGSTMLEFNNANQLAELQRLRPRVALMLIGFNDTAAGIGAMQTRYATLVTALKSVGTIILHCGVTPSASGGGVDPRAFNNWVKTNYPADFHCIVANAVCGRGHTITTGGTYALDDVYGSDASHPNGKANQRIADIISGALVTHGLMPYGSLGAAKEGTDDYRRSTAGTGLALVTATAADPIVAAGAQTVYGFRTTTTGVVSIGVEGGCSYEIDGTVDFALNGATITKLEVWIGNTAGNSTSGIDTLGNYSVTYPNLTAATENISLSTPRFRVDHGNTGSVNTYMLKCRATFSAGTVTARGQLRTRAVMP